MSEKISANYIEIETARDYDKAAGELARVAGNMCRNNRSWDEQKQNEWQESFLKIESKLEKNIGCRADEQKLKLLALEKILSWRQEDPRLENSPLENWARQEYFSGRQTNLLQETAGGDEQDFFTKFGQLSAELKKKGIEASPELMEDLKEQWIKGRYNSEAAA